MKPRGLKRRRVAELIEARPPVHPEPEETEETEGASEADEDPVPEPDGSVDDTTSRDRFEDNLSEIEEALGHPEDLVISRLLIAGQVRAALAFIDGLIDSTQLQEYLIKRLTTGFKNHGSADITPGALLAQVKESVVPTARISSSDGVVETVNDGVLRGSVALIADGLGQVLLLDIQGGEKRAVEEPVTESVVRGPRSGFTEVLRTNTTLLRRTIVSRNLRMESLTLGRSTQTKVVLAYLDSVANPAVVAEARHRLSRIDIDGIIESHYIEELIADNPYTPFPQVSATERPDVVAASLLEGRIAILTNGTPFVLVVPATFFSFLISPEDYYQYPVVATFFRSLRLVAAFVTVLLPAIYVALVTFHQAVVPTGLAINIAAGREAAPFPSLLESLGMLFTFEVLREAGTRLPRQLGQAMTMVGAVILGLAAVQARLIGPIMMFLIGITGITTFVIPSQAMVLVLRLMAFPMLLLGGTFGFLGIAVGFTLLHVHLVALRSFGVPYMAPLAPVITPDLKDFLVRVPWWAMDKRPWFAGQRNARRQERGLKPEPPPKTSGGPRLEDEE